MYRNGANPPASVELKKIENNKAVLDFVLKEGKKRQIRLLCSSVGLGSC
jgi:16S rRNA U516 pseudouridylate synthase RsuA-like enzyme